MIGNKHNTKSIHPFPARMAPEIALDALKKLEQDSVVLDPMVGSGTSIKVATGYGCKCIGFDLDPMAVLISNVWNSSINAEELLSAGQRVMQKALESRKTRLPWADKETRDYIKFWFAKPQSRDLAKLSRAIYFEDNTPITSVMKVALSRCIITKDKGASLARDVSHGKPHKTKEVNDYQVIEGFQKSLKVIVNRLQSTVSNSLVDIQQGDARNMVTVADSSVDYIITSPPYLHAVDYFRGHRLSLVWLGYTLKQIRGMRSQSVGIEKKPDSLVDESFESKLLENVCQLELLPPIKRQHLLRYAMDLYLICAEFYRTLKSRGRSTVVIADSWSKGVLISNTQLFKNAAALAGLDLQDEYDRQIPANRRYLPPPEYLTNSDLDKRMKKESILKFIKP